MFQRPRRVSLPEKGVASAKPPTTEELSPEHGFVIPRLCMHNWPADWNFSERWPHVSVCVSSKNGRNVAERLSFQEVFKFVAKFMELWQSCAARNVDGYQEISVASK